MADNNGKINSCSTSGCGYRCCEFQQGNFIVLYPGEFETAQASGQSLAHLKIIDDDYNKGKKAICRASDTALCNNGYKPLDCVSYPFFPDVDPISEDMTGFIKGKKCPLQIQHLQTHWQLVQREWTKVIDQNPEVAGWLSKVEMVGYTEPLRQGVEIDPIIAPKRAAVA